MSLYRFVYYSGVAGGWAALLAWMLAEGLLWRHGGGMGTVIGVAALVGAAIGGGLNLASGTANALWQRQLPRFLAGILGGGVGGAVGGLAGNLAFLLLGLLTGPDRVSGWLFAGRALGWSLMGLAIGAAGGICDKSRRQTRNGALGGAIGGLLGGLLFDPLTAAGSGMAARATAFVILGASIGALVGLAQLVLKEAWLTVVNGYRPGREWIIGQDVTILGRGDHLPLPFLGYPGRDLESEHARIVRQPDGALLLEDKHSRLGTRLNGQSIQLPTPLADGDLIKIGSNIVRFNFASEA